MHSEPLDLHHQELLEPRLKQLNIFLSEYSFANLYLFRKIHQYQVIQNQDLIFIQGKTRDGHKYLMPTTSPESLNIDEMLAFLSEVADFIFPIPEIWEPFFPKDKFIITSSPDDSDYLYTSEKMKTYPGRHLSGRRNLVRQYETNLPHHHEEVLASNNLSEAITILEKWHEYASHNDQETDYAECMEAINFLDKLKMKGRLYYSNGESIGFLIGEPLNEEVFVYHFAKGLTSYKGVYQYMYQEFSLSLPPNFKWINLEQDLGSKEQQHAKKSYQPDQLALKLRLQPI